MTARTVAAKIRAKKKARLSQSHDLPETPKRERNGRKSRAGTDRNPAKTAMKARAAKLGAGPHDAVTGAHFSHDMGFVLQSKCSPQEVSRLWQVFASWDAACETYAKRYLCMTGRPKGASIEMVRDRFEADASAHVDLRPEDERDRAAKAAKARWDAMLRQMGRRLAEALEDARTGQAPVWDNHEPTRAGLAALAALRELAKVSSASK